jgi:site-specific DNA recombinase
LWNPSTLSGSIELGEGILNNELYIGRRIFNKRTWVEVPTETRGFRRQPRLNPKSEWIVRDEPDLRIIDQDLWDRVKARQQDARQARDAHFKITANPLGGAKRPTHILSGLVECGTCGRPFLATGGGRWRCKGHRHGQCDNGSVTTKELEDRVLAGIRTRLLTPALVSRFAASLQKELAQAQKASNADRDRIEVKLGETRERIARLVRRLEDEEDAPRALVQRLKTLEEEEKVFAASLTATPAATVIRLPANYEQHYLRAIETLDECMASDDGAAAREALRGLVERIVVQPGTARGGGQRPIQLHGDLFGMLAFAEQATAAGQKRKQPRSFRTEAVVTPLVAGTGFEPVTFRL